MSTEIVKIDPKEFGIEDTKAADIQAQFQPMLDKMVELENDYNEVLALPVEEKETAKKARELRLKYMKIRTATLDIHKKQKAFYLAGGRFVDGWMNAQKFASLGKEEKLEEIEKYAENLEKQRLAELQQSRMEQLAPYEVENLDSLNLSGMADNVWENFLAGTITNYEAKKKAEQEAREAEEKRLAEEAAERERVRLENERLKKEAEALKALRDERSKLIAPYIQFLGDFNAVLDLSDEDFTKALQEAVEAKLKHDEAERLKAEEEEKERNRLIDEQKKKNIEEAKKRKEAEEKAEKERKDREAAEKELAAEKQRQAEAAAEAERLAEAELSKGDKDKMQSLIDDLNALKTKYQFKSKKHKALYDSICELITKTVTYAESKQ
jgi:hypothetical protein